MDEKVLDEIRFHQESVTKDATSPLHLIREKEMEISGRVLAAKKQAEEIVAFARRKAGETVAKAKDQAESDAQEHRRKVEAEVEAEVERLRADAVADIESLEKTIAGRRPDAVAFLVDTVKRV